MFRSNSSRFNIFTL